MNINNPYQELYHNKTSHISKTTTMKEAQDLSIQLSFMYNAFGIALKDTISLLSYLYNRSNNQAAQTVDSRISVLKSDKNVNAHKLKQYERTVPKIDEVNENNQIGSRSINLDQYQYKVRQQIQQKPIRIKAVIKECEGDIESKQGQNVQRIEKVRGRRQRQQLNGYSCTMCEKFYLAIGDQCARSSNGAQFCDSCSRHRSNLPSTKYFNNFSQDFGFDD